MGRDRLHFYSWFPRDFRDDTDHLTFTERAVYREVLDLIFLDGGTLKIGSTDDGDRLARRIGVSVEEFATAWPAVRLLLDVDEETGQLTQKRMQDEIARASRASTAGRKAARARWKSRPNVPPRAPDADAMRSHSDGNATKTTIKNTTTTQDEDGAEAGAAVSDFDAFWSAYPRKIGKAAARKAWARLAKPTKRGPSKLPSIADLVDAVERWKASPDFPTDARFIPHPSTWLNAGRWDDELAPPFVGRPRHPADVPDVKTSPARSHLRLVADLLGDVVIEHELAQEPKPLPAELRRRLQHDLRSLAEVAADMGAAELDAEAEKLERQLRDAVPGDAVLFPPVPRFSPWSL